MVQKNMDKMSGQEQTESKSKTIKLQSLYDLRGLTGYISGVDLHKEFEKLVGEPSPSGYKEINEEELAKLSFDSTKSVLDALNTPLGQLFDTIVAYALETNDEAYIQELKELFASKMSLPFIKVSGELEEAIKDHYFKKNSK